ncbi:MAG: FprA family A-type flavoprotein [Bacteroidales bacterium]|nr:FprA family A-type flavoprotein [Bacteroidales bacterium]
MKQIAPIKITGSVYWTGILDEDLVTFDIVMETTFGTTYNSYLIQAEKKAVIDTAKGTFSEEYLNNLRSLTSLDDIQYVICNHTEPDHSGSLAALLEVNPGLIVVGSGQALNYLSEMIDRPFEKMKIKDGDQLSLGDKTLTFIGAANLHWPDSIYTYLEEDRLLFTCDSFGAHFCDERMFDDQVGDYSEAFKYYFDVILKPYSRFLLKAIGKIEPLEIQAICPGHGPILRSSWKEIVNLSRQHASEYVEITGSTSNRVLIAYISAYGYTKEMAHIIARGITRAGKIETDVVDIEHISLGDLEEKIVRSSGILIGSPTINRNTLLPVYRMFAVINPIRDKGKPAATFGSYGWSGEAVNIIEEHLKNLKLDVILQGLATKFYPDKSQSDELELFGENFGRKFLEYIKEDSESSSE